MKKPSPAKAVTKTMKIMECLSLEGDLGIIELTRRLSTQVDGYYMNKSTVYRFLQSLQGLGFVRQDPETGQLWREAEPVVKEMARLTGETIHLATLEAASLVYLWKVESTRTLRVAMMSRVGQTAPTYCTGVGKVLLAHLLPEQVNAILKKEKLTAYTDRTITRRDELVRELAGIREKGYAVDNEEHEVGVRCVAAPIRDRTGTVCAAVSVSIPTVRLTNRDIPRYRDIVVRAAGEISLKMGYRGSYSVPASQPKKQ
jgi:DNA-binding IclR family transcriptional regulator